MLSPLARRNILRIIPFGVIWLIFSIVYTLVERGVLGTYNYYPSTGNPYNFTRNIFLTPAAALIAGLLIGTAEILFFNKLFIHRSFTKKMVFKSLIYLVLIISFLLAVTTIANAFELKQSFLSPGVWDNVWKFFFGYAFFSVALYMGAIIIVSQFYAEVSENIGQGVLNNFFIGKYHRATEEKRIFMFLDMKSSTSIAENLGHERYFEMLREYYADLSDPIIRYAGEIYQYVGDEVVVSWNLHKGLLNNNCIQCFFALREAIESRSKKYLAEFGVVPQFKAGFHAGKVATGEIGALKKEIVFTGDVLNTTARIQGLCNAYHTNILVSEDLIKLLSVDGSFVTSTIGEHALRGRDERITLYKILPTNKRFAEK